MPQRCIAVVGPGEGADERALADASALGRLIAEHGWVTLTGGRAVGVMAAAADGAASVGGLAIGLLPGADRGDAAPALTVALPTGLGEARNAVLVTAADAVIGCGLSPGTASELALALRLGRPTVLVRPAAASAAFFAALADDTRLHVAGTPADAVAWLAATLPDAATGP
ncbi:MAG TPA: hypothetical protein VFS08_10140 [Gemmatimonadaceae bacterium]|nr:hypothetical protein [Gemmatimonadaceae bacterium]